MCYQLRPVEIRVSSKEKLRKCEAKEHRENQKDKNNCVGRRLSEIGVKFAFEDGKNSFHDD